jgi:phage-related tail fiber protein
MPTSINNTQVVYNDSTTQTSSWLPVGTVIFYAASTAPTGFLKANGAAVSRSTYANLFAAISTTFGAGDGSTTFNVPDLRGYFVRGWDDARGVDSGRGFGSNQNDAMQGHLHGFRRYPALGGGSGNTQLATPGSGIINNSIVSGPINNGTNGVPRTATESRPINIALLICIKF